MEKYARAELNGKEIARENLRASVNERKSFMLSLLLPLSHRRTYEKGNAYSRKRVARENVKVRSWRTYSKLEKYVGLDSCQPAGFPMPFAENECSSWAMVTPLTVFHFSPRVALLTRHLSPRIPLRFTPHEMLIIAGF